MTSSTVMVNGEATASAKGTPRGRRGANEATRKLDVNIFAVNLLKGENFIDDGGKRAEEKWKDQKRSAYLTSR